MLLQHGDIYLIRCFGVKSVVLYFDKPAGRVKIQTMNKKHTAILHTETSNKRFIIQLNLSQPFSVA